MQIDLILFKNDRRLRMFYSNQNFLSISVYLGDLHFVPTVITVNDLWLIDTTLSEIVTYPMLSETKIGCP